jgi:hypothetical protein
VFGVEIGRTSAAESIFSDNSNSTQPRSHVGKFQLWARHTPSPLDATKNRDDPQLWDPDPGNVVMKIASNHCITMRGPELGIGGICSTSTL